MPVDVVQRPGRDAVAFIVCHKRDDINRVDVNLASLARWRITSSTLADGLADLLGRRGASQLASDTQTFRIGVVKGRADPSVVHVRVAATGPVLELAGHTLALDQVLNFQGASLAFDMRRLQRCANAPVIDLGAKPEDPTARAERLAGRKRELLAKGTRNFVKVISKEEDITDTMTKRLIARAEFAAKSEPVAPKRDPFVGWAAALQTPEGVSKGDKPRP